LDDLDVRLANEAQLAAFFDAIGDADFGALGSICAPDFVAELPYSDPPQRFEGFAAYRAAVEPSLSIFRFRLSLDRLHPAVDPDLLIAEYTGEGIAVPTGKPYSNTYIGILRFSEGRLVFLREFFNPKLADVALEAD